MWHVLKINEKKKGFRKDIILNIVPLELIAVTTNESIQKPLAHM